MKRVSLNNSDQFFTVDDEDYNEVIKHKWCLTSDGAIQTKVPIANFILNTRKMVDHKNNDTFNNQKYNLRECNGSQNMANRKKFKINGQSQYKGVRYNKKSDRWFSAIGVDGNKLYLGSFRDEEAAAKAYNIAARHYFGEFASINVIKKAEAV